MTTDGGGWTMVYKLTSAVAGDPLALWRGQPVNEADGTILNVDASTAHYVNRIVSRFWNRSGFTIGEARVNVYENGLRQAQFFQFDATGATREGWFSSARLANSGYTSPPTGSGNYFSIAGHEELGRYWFINQSYDSCPGDRGWLVADIHVGEQTCVWEAPAGGTVRILYSTVAGSATWDSASATEPDVMAVFVR